VTDSLEPIPAHPRVADFLDLTNLRDLRSLLTAHGIRPNKSFGQNFLIDRSVLNKVLDASAIEKGDEVLEVGAGTGVLTRELAQMQGVLWRLKSNVICSRY